MVPRLTHRPLDDVFLCLEKESMMNKLRIPTLETNRLILRAVTMDDASDMFAYTSNPEVTRYLSFPTHTSVEDAQWAIANIFMKRPDNGSPEAFAIVDKMTHQMIGTCDFWRVDGDNTYEMGYVLNQAYWGQGIMTEACRAVLKFAFEDFGVRRMEIRHNAENIGSRNIIKKQGFTYEGVRRRLIKIDDHYSDIVYYAMLDEEFK